MSKQMTPTQQTASQSAELQLRMLVTIFAPNIPQPFRFIANTDADLLFEGETYYSAAVERGEIKSSTDGDKEQVSLKMSNKWQTWASYFATNGHKLNGCRCLIQEVFLDQLDEGAVWSFEGVLDDLRMTISDFSCVVVRARVDFSQHAPQFTYSPTCQYVYKDGRCRAVSALAACDHTLTACEERGNVTRFGGHPSIPREMVIRNDA